MEMPLVLLVGLLGVAIFQPLHQGGKGKVVLERVPHQVLPQVQEVHDPALAVRLQAFPVDQAGPVQQVMEEQLPFPVVGQPAPGFEGGMDVGGRRVRRRIRRGTEEAGELGASVKEPAPTALASDPDAVVVDSFSKYFGMTGWRLGWCVLPDALVGPVERLVMNYLLCASAPAQLAALAALTPESLAVCEQRRRHLVTRRAIGGPVTSGS